MQGVMASPQPVIKKQTPTTKNWLSLLNKRQ